MPRSPLVHARSPRTGIPGPHPRGGRPPSGLQGGAASLDGQGAQEEGQDGGGAAQGEKREKIVREELDQNLRFFFQVSVPDLYTYERRSGVVRADPNVLDLPR